MRVWSRAHCLASFIPCLIFTLSIKKKASWNLSIIAACFFSTLGGACSLPIPGEDYMYNGHKQNIQSNVNTHQTTGFSSLFFFLILFYRLGNYLPSIPPSSISISLSRSPALDCSPCIDFISNYFIEYWREGTSHT